MQRCGVLGWSWRIGRITFSDVCQGWARWCGRRANQGELRSTDGEDVPGAVGARHAAIGSFKIRPIIKDKAAFFNGEWVEATVERLQGGDAGPLLGYLKSAPAPLIKENAAVWAATGAIGLAGGEVGVADSPTFKPSIGIGDLIGLKVVGDVGSVGEDPISLGWIGQDAATATRPAAVCGRCTSGEVEALEVRIDRHLPPGEGCDGGE